MFLIFLQQCLPSKVKRSESGGVAWRRKNGSKAKYPARRSSTPPNVRPTLLLPPMRCTTTVGLAEESSTTAPVVTTRVQQGEGAQIRDGFLSLVSVIFDKMLWNAHFMYYVRSKLHEKKLSRKDKSLTCTR